MGIFNFFQNSVTAQQQTSTEEKKRDFDYNECKRLYVNFGLGKRIVNSLPNFSLASPRKIIIKNAPDEVVQQFEKTLEKYRIDDLVLRTSKIARVYGLSTLLVLTNKEDDNYEHLTAKDLEKNEIFFNVLDPQCTTIDIEQNPLSLSFLKPSNLSIRGKSIDKTRGFICFNGMPMYLDYQQSAYNFAGQSVFANMHRFIEVWVNLYSALERISIKASSILIKNNNGGGMNNPLDIEVSKRASAILQQLKQGGIAFLSQGQEAEFFNLNGAGEISQMIQEVKNGLAMALDDTPTAILLDRELSNGLSEGSEDMKAVVMAVNRFRNDTLNPIYNFIDGYMYYKAWDKEFIKEMKIKYPEKYAKLGINQIRQIWINDFNFIWESIYPKTPNEETKEKDGFLDRLAKAKELGATSESLEKILNDNDDIFGNDVILEKNNFGLENEHFEEDI